MTASYPSSVHVFTPHVNTIDVIDASHPNILQDEVTAIESTLGTTPNVSTTPATTGWTGTSTSFSSVAARLANIELGIVGDSHSQYVKNSVITAKGDLIVGSAAATATNLSAGTTGQVLSVDPTQTSGLKWINPSAGYTAPTIGTTSIPSGTTVSTLNGVTLTSSTLTSPTVNAPTIAGGSLTNASVASLIETATYNSGAIPGSLTYNCATQSVLYYGSAATTNISVNFVGNNTTSMNNYLPNIGNATTVVLMNTNGATPYYVNAISIDGVSVSPRWQGGTVPNSGNASALDVYSFTIIKTGSATYTVLASQIKFA